MDFNDYTLWDIYIRGLHPGIGTAVLLLSIAMGVAGISDRRSPFWSVLILIVVFLGWCIGEIYFENGTVMMMSRFQHGGGNPYHFDAREFVGRAGRVFFLIQAGIAVTISGVLLWLPNRPKGES